MPHPSFVHEQILNYTMTWKTTSSAVCVADSGVLGESTWIERRVAQDASKSTTKEPNIPRPPTDWWGRYGEFKFPIISVFGQQTSGFCSGRGYTSVDGWGASHLLPPINMAYKAEVKNAAIIKLLNGMKGSGGSLGINLVTRLQTERLIIESAERIANDILSFRKRYKRLWDEFQNELRPKGVRRRNSWQLRPDGTRRTYKSNLEKVGKRFSDDFLAMQYGWRPLIADVQDAANRVDYQQQNNLYFQLSYGRVKVPGDNYVKTAVSGNGCVLTGTSRRTDFCDAEVYWYVQTDILSSLAAMGLTNPLAVGWDAMPWSFVVDWFVPLGNWFNTFDATLGKGFQSGFITEKYRLDPMQFHVGDPSVPGWDLHRVITSPGGGSGYVSINREKLHSFPSASRPEFRSPFSPERVANALGLLIGAITRR